METKSDPFINGLRATMRAVTPPALWTAFSEQGRFDEAWNEERGQAKWA